MGSGLCVALTLWKHPQVFKLYDELAQKRDQAKGEIVESYRHLREHGNSFFIVTLELLLGVFLYIFHQTWPLDMKSDKYVFFLFLWILPASFVWLIATLLEKDFIDSVSGSKTVE